MRCDCCGCGLDDFEGFVLSCSDGLELLYCYVCFYLKGCQYDCWGSM